MSDRTTTTQFLFRGRVQGVGFRWTTRRIAARFPVTGFVRNLPDGRVELVAQGPVDSVDTFICAVRDHFKDNIDTTEQKHLAESPAFSLFEIRR